jgi:hypothetical protein
MISHITINDIPNDAAFIAATLKGLNLLISSKICLFPLFENGKFKYTAYIRVFEWIDCDAAYSVVKAMKGGKKTVAYIKDTQELWELQKTAPNDVCYTEDARFKKWITVMDVTDCDTDSDYSEYEADLRAITYAEVKEPDDDFSKFSIDQDQDQEGEEQEEEDMPFHIRWGDEVGRRIRMMNRRRNVDVVL